MLAVNAMRNPVLWSLLSLTSATWEPESLQLLQQRLTIEDAKEIPTPMTWVHFPKCGSSFLNVLIHMPGFCHIPANLSVDQDVFPRDAMMKDWVKVCPEFCDLGLLRCPLSPHGCIGNRYNNLKGHMVGLFRQPEQRLLSAYYDPDHTWLGEESDAPEPPLPEFAQLWKGQVTYQLVGEGGGPELGFSLPHLLSLPPRTLAMAEEARRRVRDGFAFVGLTEEWDLSVCLFHAMFGGQCRKMDFENIRPTFPNRTDDVYDTAPLEGFHDELDGMVYEEAVRIFRENLHKFGVSRSSCQEGCFAQAAGEDAQ